MLVTGDMEFVAIWHQHTLIQVARKKPTCVGIGWEAYEKCITCGYSTFEALPELGHYITCHESQVPTCTEIGWIAYETCLICNYTTYQEIPATGHLYASTNTEPTCTEQGYTTYVCHCGHSYISDYVSAYGHRYDGRCVVIPTCTKQGYTIYICRCGDQYTTDYRDAYGHDFGLWNIMREPTCANEGYQQRICRNCGREQNQSIPRREHEYILGIFEPTCTEQGYTTYTCECGDSYVSDYVQPVGHTFGDWHDVALGVEERSCETCGETESRDKTPNFDVDGNGTVEEADLTLLMSILVGNTETDVVFDFDFDGELTIYDGVLLMQQIQ